MKHVPCYLCGSDDPVVIDDKFEHPDPYLDLINKLYSKSKRALVTCKSCGFVYQTPRMDSSDMRLLYTSKYRQNMLKRQTPDQFFDRITQLPNTESENYNTVIWLKPYLDDTFGPAGGDILDIGCGGGMMLKTFLDNMPNWRGAGFEPTAEFAELAARRLGVEIKPEFYTPNRFSHKFRLISLVQVLEHLEDPIKLMQSVYDDLHTDGLLFIDVPDVLDLKIMSPTSDRFMSPHIHIYSKNTMMSLCRRAGFEILKMAQIKESRGFINLKILCKPNKKVVGADIGPYDDYKDILALRTAYQIDTKP